MVFTNYPKCIPHCTSLHVYSLNFKNKNKNKKLRNAALSQDVRQAQGSRFAWSAASFSSCNLWSLTKFQVLITPNCMWNHIINDNNVHEKSLEMIGQSTIRQMAWQLSSVFCSLIYKDRFFNWWQRALDPNFFIIYHSSAIIYPIQTQLASIILLPFTEK